MERTERKQDLITTGGKSTFDRVKATVAERLSEAAQAIHEKATKTTDRSELSSIGHRAADWLEHSAGYVKDMEPKQLRSDIEAKVRQNPGRSLLIAGVVGLILGSVFRRR
ncbi:MAG: hypothetical protein L0226_02890 [Acidobacteria bacterium]|nr:hypothetical protein [Acidobacteriota bacterium]